MLNQKMSHQILASSIHSLPKSLLDILFRNMTEGILITDVNKKILLVNEAFEIVTGYKMEEVIGSSPAIIQSGLHDSNFYKAMWSEIKQNGKWEGEIWNRKKTGEIYPEWLSIYEIKDDQLNIVFYLGIFTDLSERKLIENELKKQSLNDHLTDLSNRHAFEIRMERLLEKSSDETLHAVFLLNIDRFKQVNETLGHSTGDLLLVEMGHRIQSLLKNKDILARFGGDEFIFTLTNIRTPREAAQFADTIIKLLQEPIIINGQELFVSSSIGISLYPEDGTTVDELVTNAVKAMTYSKSNEQQGFSFYFDELRTDGNRVLLLDQELRKAIENKEFTLNYQPKIDLKTMQIVGVEALVRWNNKRLGFVSPGEFIPYAEETGLIIPLSEIIFEKACEDYVEIAKAGYSNLTIAINISSIQFNQQNFLDSLKKILERNNMTANHFEIEVTERTVMNTAQETISKLVRLKQLGFKLAIDDFGTGYSSLNYLIRFPLDVLKIDHSFVQHITSLAEKQAIVDAIIQMSHRLKMKVVAEGVESAQQASLLEQMGCDYAQGFYFSRPIPIDELIELLPLWEYGYLERD